MEKLARRGINRVANEWAGQHWKIGAKRTNREAKAWAGPDREIGVKPSPRAGPHERHLHKAWSEKGWLSHPHSKAIFFPRQTVSSLSLSRPGPARYYRRTNSGVDPLSAINYQVLPIQIQVYVSETLVWTPMAIFLLAHLQTNIPCLWNRL